MPSTLRAQALLSLALWYQFSERIDRSGGPDACHPWTGRPNPSTGYGQLNWIAIGGKERTHVLAWEFEHKQEVPRNPETGRKLDVDHLCHNKDSGCPGGKKCPHRLCCNPRHLEIKQPKENKEAADEPRKRGKFRTHFACGCEITPENTYIINPKTRRENDKLKGPRRRCKKHERIKQNERRKA